MTFSELRQKNVERCETSFHPLADWSLCDWATALAGECGEACNLIKKRRRGETIPADAIADEIADVVIYADLLAARLGVNLEAAVQRKFNEVSQRVGSSIRIEEPA